MMRLDCYLFEHGWAPSRQKARALIEEGCVLINGKVIQKPSFLVEEGNGQVVSVIPSNTLKYVSRGGLKLEKALEEFAISVEGLTVLDIGASTGGFTNCLLQRGAKKVYAVDSGHGQLHPDLLADPRVISLESYNAKNLCLEDIGEYVDLAVADLSFISQKQIIEPMLRVLKKGGIYVSLIKPQFEAGREFVGKNGIVKDLKVHKRVIEELFAFACKNGLFPCGICLSPIKGGDGNTEYLAFFRNSRNESAVCPSVCLDSLFDKRTKNL